MFGLGRRLPSTVCASTFSDVNPIAETSAWLAELRDGAGAVSTFSSSSVCVGAGFALSLLVLLLLLRELLALLELSSSPRSFLWV